MARRNERGTEVVRLGDEQERRAGARSSSDFGSRAANPSGIFAADDTTANLQEWHTDTLETQSTKRDSAGEVPHSLHGAWSCPNPTHLTDF